MVALPIAVRYLFAKKSHKAVNIISAISVAGVAVATAAIICVLSVFNGFTKISENRLSQIDADLKIQPSRGKTIANADSIIELLREVKGVEQSVPVIEERVLAIYGGRQLPVTIKGVGDGYKDVSGIEEILIDGNFSEPGEEDYHGATLSVGTAVNLNARPGFIDHLILYAPKRVGRINPAVPMSAFRTDTLLVEGVYETGQAEYDSDRMIVPLESARQLLDYETEATAIEVSLKPGADEKKTAAEILRILPGDYSVKNRLEQQEQSFKMISMEKWITFAMLAFVLLIASFNVISTLSMLIIEKADNISTLRSIGADKRQVGSIFAWEGMLISLIGGVTGTVLGVILCYAQQWGEFIKLNGDPSRLSITVYPVLVEWSDIGIVLGLVCIIGLLIAAISGRYANKVSI